MKRRPFLLGTAAVCLPGCGVGAPRRPPPVEVRAPTTPTVEPAVEPVSGAIMRAFRATRDAHEDALGAAIEGAGGLGFIREGETVFVKVNTNSGHTFPYSSSPTAVAWLARQIQSRGGRAVFGDRSFWGDAHTSRNFDTNGIRLAVESSNAELLVLDDDVAWVELDPATAPNWVPPVRVPRVALEAAHVVNLACAKTHFIAGATLALKNLIGFVHAVDRMREGNLKTHDRARLPHQIADIHRAVRPRLHVVDGFRALVTGGPTPMSGDGPTIVDAKTVIASTDPIACDVAGILLLQEHAPESEAIARVDAWEHPTVRGAIDGNIGDARRGSTEIARV
ncbi:MAG: DUF362 domain-containing protein [Polyangiaceae bacterium]